VGCVLHRRHAERHTGGRTRSTARRRRSLASCTV
jgi:hypothetical protein